MGSKKAHVFLGGGAQIIITDVSIISLIGNSYVLRATKEACYSTPKIPVRTSLVSQFSLSCYRCMSVFVYDSFLTRSFHCFRCYGVTRVLSLPKRFDFISKVCVCVCVWMSVYVCKCVCVCVDVLAVRDLMSAQLSVLLMHPSLESVRL